MTRRILTNLNLSGQVIDASLQPDGHARQSLIRGCNLTGAIVLGDMRGSDIFGSDLTNCDLTGALVYNTYWRGNTMTGSRWPTDIGFLHHDPVAEIIRARAALVVATARPKVQQVASFVLGNYLSGSWDPSKSIWWDGLTTTQRNRLITAFRLVFQPYPQLAARFEALMALLQSGRAGFTGNAPTAQTLTWDDGVTVTLDALNLPVLSDLSRYSLARWAEQQAGLGHECIVWSAYPMRAMAVPMGHDPFPEEAWISIYRYGF